MPGETLQWAFELYDKVSGQADKMTRALEKLEGTMGKTKGAGEKFQNSFAGFSGPIGTTVGLLKSLGEAVFNVGEHFASTAFEAVAFKESTMVSLQAMTGSAKDAQTVFQRAMVFAHETPLDTRTSVDLFKQLMGGGFQGQGLENMFAALADVAAMSGTGSEEMARITTQIIEGKAMGKFQMRHLMPILIAMGKAGAGGPGGSASDVLYEQIAKNTGTTKSAVHEGLSSGTISADAAIDAMLQVIGKNVSKGELGKASVAQAHTLGGLMSTIGSLKDELLFSTKLEGKGVLGIKHFMDDLITSFGKLVGEGGSLSKIINDVVDDFGSWVEKQGGVDNLTKKMEEMVQGARDFWEVLKGIGSTVEALLPSFKDIGDALKTAAYLVNPEYAKKDKASRGVADVSFGTALEAADARQRKKGLTLNPLEQAFRGGETFNDTINGWLFGVDKGALEQAGASMGEQLEVGARDQLEMHSPSRVFERLGEQTAQGFALGIAGGDAQASLGEMLAAPKAEAGGGRGRGGASFAPGSIVMQFKIEGTGLDPEAVARKISDMLPGELLTLFERLGLELGVT